MRKTLWPLCINCMLIYATSLGCLSDADYELQLGETQQQISWDWTIDQIYPLYFNSGSGIDVQNVRLPYYDNTGPAAELNTGADRDIQPADGWVSIYRNFGTSTSGTTVPLFILYNKFRGTLRLFFYNTSLTNYSYASASLSQPFQSKAASLLGFGSENYFLDTFDPSAKITTIIKIGPFQWSYADFTIMSYDDTLNVDATLQFELTGITESAITVAGNLTLNQVLDQANMSGSIDPKGALEAGIKQYKNTSKAMTDLQKEANDHPNAWYSTPLKTILSSSIANFAPGIAGLVGFIGSFVSGAKTNAVQPLNFQGELHLSGTITTPAFVFSTFIRAPGAPLSDPNDPFRSDYPYPLGLFNLNKPTLSCYTTDDCFEDVQWGLICQATSHCQMPDPLNVKINPFIAAPVDIQVGYVAWADTTFYTSAADFQTQVFEEYSGQVIYSEPYAEKIAIKMTVTPASSPPVVVVNTFVPWL